jgi:hypothetical protein
MQKIDAKSQPKVSGEMIHISSSTPRDSQRNIAIDKTFAARPNTKGGTIHSLQPANVVQKGLV